MIDEVIHMFNPFLIVVLASLSKLTMVVVFGDDESKEKKDARVREYWGNSWPSSWWQLLGSE
jgi:hypothetical protein